MPLFKRSQLNPIIKPQPGSVWQSVMTYNPGVVENNGRYYLFYRAVGQAWVSRIGLALGQDAENFSLPARPLLEPEAKMEKNGLEDPRITRINGVYYLTYTAYDGQTARLFLSISHDLNSWRRQGNILPGWNPKRAGEFEVPWDTAQHNESARRHWVKAGAIMPGLIHGRYLMFFGDRHIWHASSPDGLDWQPELRPWLSPRPGRFDSVHLEMGPPPLLTEAGWLLLYHGVDESITYRLGLALLDPLNPLKIIHRSDRPVFEPREPYEVSGLVDLLPGGFGALEKMEPKEIDKLIRKKEKERKMPRVIFCNGALIEKGDTLRIYYGAGDTCIGTAVARLDEIFKEIGN